MRWGVTGADGKADGVPVTGSYGYEFPLLEYSYRAAECYYYYHPSASCEGDELRLTFDYVLEISADALVPKTGQGHHASALVSAILALRTAGPPWSETRRPLYVSERISVETSHDNRHVSQTKSFSGTVYIDIQAGEAVRQFLNVNQNGTANLAPMPVPLPASVLFLLAGLSGLVAVARQGASAA
jgi:hypothetical protein